MTHHLVGAQEIATMLGVTRQRVDQLAKTEEFPEPEVALATGRIWKRSDVERWAVKNGRPPKARRGGRES